MGFEKAIEHGKTRRKPYRGGKAVDSSCRNHGDCPICKGNRLRHNKIRQQAADQQLEDIR